MGRNILLHFSCLVLFALSSAQARLGETPNEFAHRYGRPTHPDKRSIESPLLKNAQVRIYQQGHWRIRAAFMTIASPAVKVEYWRKDRVHLSDADIGEILAANSNGLQWKKVVYRPPGKDVTLGPAVMANTLGLRRWERSDGVVAYTSPQKLIIETPAAAAHAAKVEEKRRSQEVRPKF